MEKDSLNLKKKRFLLFSLQVTPAVAEGLDIRPPALTAKEEYGRIIIISHKGSLRQILRRCCADEGAAEAVEFHPASAYAVRAGRREARLLANGLPR